MSPHSMDRRNAHSYRRRAAPIIYLGLSGLIVGLAGLLDPTLLTTSSAVQKLEGWVDEAWLTLYAVGGAAAAWGAWSRHPAIEGAGCSLLASACLINAGAILANRGPIGGGVTAAPLILTAWVLVLRIRDHQEAAKGERRVHTPAIPYVGTERRRHQ